MLLISNTSSIDTRTPIRIICKQHGEFLQSPHDHLEGRSCPKCASHKVSIGQIQWLSWMSCRNSCTIQHAENLGEFRIPGTMYHANSQCDPEPRTERHFYQLSVIFVSFTSRQKYIKRFAEQRTTMADFLWRVIPNFSKYEASQDGQIRSADTKRIIKQKASNGGYLKVVLQSEDRPKSGYVHRLVASAWISNPDEKPTVDHLNRCRGDNRVVNLRWATFKEQYSNRAACTEPKVDTRTCRICQQDIISGRLIAIHRSLREASLAVRGNDSGMKNISTHLRGKSKSAYGYVWKHAEIQNIESEIWISISRLHQISNMGRLRNKTRLLTCTPDNSGYPAVSIKMDDGTSLNTSLHILVARHFVPNVANFPIVNHIDGDKMNPKACNLEWCNHNENATHAVLSGLRKNVYRVIQVNDQELQIGEVYPSCVAAANALLVNPTSVNKVCKGLLRSCGKAKLKFRFIDHPRSCREEKQTNQENNAGRSKVPLRVAVLLRSTGKGCYECNSIAEAAQRTGCNVKTVAAHCRGNVRHPTGKFTFKFI